MAKVPEQATRAKVPGQARPGAEAAEIALSPLAYGEAPRIGLLGDTRVGKTTAARQIVDLYLRRSLGVVLVVDDKNPRAAQFTGQERGGPVDLIGEPLDPRGPRVVVFRGDPSTGESAYPDDVADFAWTLHGRGRPSLTVFDELNHEHLTTYGMWQSGITATPRLFGKGGGVGAGVLWGTQSPQDVPRAAFEQSSCILCFKLAGNGLRKLRELDYLGGGAEAVIPTFPGDEVPPPQRGQHVILQRGKPWNGVVYRW